MVTYNDGTTSTFTVTNGNGIVNISLTSQNGLIDIYTITYSDGTIFEYSVVNAATWHTGEGVPDNSIVARVGDFYIDLLTSNVYELTNSGWYNITNIKGISVVEIDVQSLYDEYGKFYKRYTFMLSDGTKEIVDVYDDKKVYMIEEAEYYVYVSSDPTVIPDIELKVIYSNSNIDYVKLENWMIMNINEVHFSITGTYKLFIQYYNVNAYITIHIIPEEPTPSDKTYLNESSIIWSENNFNSFLGLYLNVIWDRPTVLNTIVPLNSSSVTITKKDGSYITENDKGKNLELLVTYKNHSVILNVYWMSDNVLKNCKVNSFEYVGEVVYWDQNFIKEDNIYYPNFDIFGYVKFVLNTSSFTASYIRSIDPTVDEIRSIDDDKLFGYDNLVVDQILYYNLFGPIQPGVTTKLYCINNTLPMYVNRNDSNNDIVDIIEVTGISLSDYDLTTSDYSVPEVDVTFNFNVDPFAITVPLSIEMLDDPNIFKTEGIKSISISYNYGGTLLTGTVDNVYIHKLSNITETSSNPNPIGSFYRNYQIEPVKDEMKTTRSSDIIPTIGVVVSYVRYKKTISIDWDKWPNISINHDTDYYIIEEQVIVLTKSTITNIEYLDFSKPGSKEIKFMLNGKEQSIHIDFYDLYSGIIESIKYNVGSYDTDAIPSSISMYDIGNLYLNLNNMIAYERYSGSWKEFANLSTLGADETMTATLSNGEIMYIQYAPSEYRYKYSYDNITFNTLFNTQTNDTDSSNNPWFISVGMPHNNISKNDILFKIKNTNGLKVGTTLKISYYEPVNGIEYTEIVIDESFYESFDFTGFQGSYIGSQNIKFNYQNKYIKNIVIEIKPLDSKFELYENLNGITTTDSSDNSVILDLYVDEERNLIGSSKTGSSYISDYHSYYIIEDLGNNKGLAIVCNMNTIEGLNFGSSNPTAEELRVNLDTLYKLGILTVIIDFNNKTIELYENVEYIKVDITEIDPSGEVEAYFRIDGQFGEVKIVTSDGTQVMRFNFKSYDNDRIIEVNDIIFAESFAQFYLTLDESGAEPIYKFNIGKYGIKYTLDTTTVPDDLSSLSNVCIVICPNNQLYMTYDGMSPNDIYLIPFTKIDDNTIYVYSQNRLAYLDNTNMVASMYEGEVYNIDISVVPTGSAIINSSIIVKTTDVMTMILNMTVDGVEVTQSMEYYYYEIESGKFDVYLTENNSVSSYEKQLYDDYYIELVNGEMIVKEDQVTRTFNIDYSECKSLPDGISVEDIISAYITISSKDSTLSIYINDILYFSTNYIYKSFVNSFYINPFGENEDLMFSFEIIDDSTVKLIDLKPGKEYQLDISLLLALEGEGLIAGESYIRLNEYGECSVYIEILAYNSFTGRYETELIKYVLDYAWYDNECIQLYESGSLMPMYIKLVDENTFKICYGTPEIERVLFTTDGTDPIILYKNGVASCDTSFGLVNFCFYEYLDEDTIYVVTLLGIGIIYDIVNETLVVNTEYFDNSRIFEEEIVLQFEELTFVIHKYKNSNEVFIEYLTNNDGNGEEITAAYFKGEVINDELYYSSYLFFFDQFIYNIDGQSILVLGLD